MSAFGRAWSLLNVCVRRNRPAAVCPVPGMYFSTVYDASWQFLHVLAATIIGLLPACDEWQSEQLAMLLL